MRLPSNSAFIKFIFFGNYFYGLCAVALSIEASLQQQYPLNSLLYYTIVFCATTIYYTKAYITEVTADTSNKRSLWYVQFRRFVFFSQILFTIITAAGSIVFLRKNWFSITHLSLLNWALIVVFPAVAALYYGVNSKRLKRYNLRNTGWLKPFVIGFAWAGAVTIYPVLFYSIDQGLVFIPTLVGIFLFVKNFMFITVLCIMFDIKDYAVDYNHHLKTFVVKMGLRKTIFYIIIPLCIIGLGSFVLYAVARHFHIMKILINTLPFIALISVAYSLHRRKSILYYLIIIDGLMLVKAICGTIAMTFF
jgi:hypothetical protein